MTRKNFSLTNLETWIPDVEGVDQERINKLVEEETQLFIERTKKSRELLKRGKEHMLHGSMTSWHRDWGLPNPIYVEKARGNRIVDIDGNEYIDFCFGDTPDVYGHATNNEVIKGVIELLENTGVNTLCANEENIIAGELLAKKYGLKYWYTSMTASDSNRFAVKIARMVTGRPKVLMFNTAYHGNVDELIKWSPEPGVIEARFQAADLFPGQDLSQTTKVVEFNDLEAVEEALKDEDVALLITEPALTNVGIQLPKPGFHEKLRELCTKYGTLLLIDETHTQIEGPSGLTGKWGLKPDIWIAGKCIAGGIPCGVYGFNEEIGDKLRDILDAPDPQGIGALTGLGTTATGNNLAMRALRLNLEYVMTEETFAHMQKMTKYLVDEMNRVIKKYNAPFSMTSLGVRCELNFIPDPEVYTTRDVIWGVGNGGLTEYMHLYAYNRGLLFIPYYNMFITSPTTKTEDVDRWIELWDEIVANILDI